MIQGTPFRPLDRDLVLATLRLNAQWLISKGVGHAFVFGSVARGEADGESDVDVLVDRRAGASLSVFDLAEIQRRLAELFGRDVDVVTRNSLHPLARPEIEREALNAF